MPRLLFGHDEKLARWCADHIPHVGADGFGPCRAVGVTSDDGARLLGVCVFHNYHRSVGLVEISFAAVSPKWATRGIIRALLSVAFEQYGCRKVCLQIPHDNARAIRFNEGIGFRREATLRHHYGQGRHVLVLSMMLNEYRARWAPQAQRIAA